MTAIKKVLHELIEVTTDERLLKAVHVILTSQSKVFAKPKTAKTGKAKIEKLILPNGRTVLVTLGDPTVDTSELFGIWKDTPEIIETLRKTAWGGRV